MTVMNTVDETEKHELDLTKLHSNASREQTKRKLCVRHKNLPHSLKGFARERMHAELEIRQDFTRFVRVDSKAIIKKR